MQELVAPNNRPVQVDDILYRSEYADLLERISQMTETSTILQQMNEEIMNYVSITCRTLYRFMIEADLLQFDITHYQ